MFIRKAFEVFIAVHSEAAASASTAPAQEWIVDWRWFSGDEPREQRRFTEWLQANGRPASIPR